LVFKTAVPILEAQNEQILQDRPDILPLRLLPHLQLSSERLRVGLHLKWRDHTPFGYILDGAIRVLYANALMCIMGSICAPPKWQSDSSQNRWPDRGEWT
jgi:hypothetical protein